MSTKLEFSADCETALKAVRDDSNETVWAALTYAEGSMQKVVLAGKGSKDADELVSQCLVPEKVVFALVRLTEVIDQSTTVKFVFVNWVGQKVRRMLKARQSIHSGSIQAFLTPHHIEIKCEELDEISQAICEERVGVTSGTRTRVLDNVVPGTAPAPVKKSTPVEKKSEPKSEPAKAASPKKEAAPKAATKAKPAEAKKEVSLRTESRSAAIAASRGARAKLSVAVDDEDAIRAAIDDVRNNDTETKWVVVSYVPKKKPATLTLLATGTGTVADMVAKMTADNVFYCLTRHIERIDNTDAVKFAHVAFTGDNTPRMLRAQKGTHKGAVESLFRPYHVDLVTEELDEITEDELMDRVKTASGTKSHVQ